MPSGKYADPVEKMKKERDEIKADRSIPENDKKLALDDLEQEIAAAQPLKFTENIDVVKKHREAIDSPCPPRRTKQRKAPRPAVKRPTAKPTNDGRTGILAGRRYSQQCCGERRRS